MKINKITHGLKISCNSGQFYSVSRMNLLWYLIVICGISLAASSCSDSPLVSIEGEKQTWHIVTLTFKGPFTAEYDTVNPFTDYRLDVEFNNGYFTARRQLHNTMV